MWAVPWPVPTITEYIETIREYVEKNITWIARVYRNPDLEPSLSTLDIQICPEGLFWEMPFVFALFHILQLTDRPGSQPGRGRMDISKNQEPQYRTQIAGLFF